MVRHPIDFVTAKHANNMVNLGELVQQRWAESLWQTARDDHTLSFSGSFEIEHFPDHRFGFGARTIDKPAGIDDDEISTIRFAHQRIPIESQRTQHLFTVHQILGTAE